jgi:hypothetical protein
MKMSRTLAQQAIEESIIEESEERARRGGSRTLAEYALDESARELKQQRKERKCE